MASARGLQAFARRPRRLALLLAAAATLLPCACPALGSTAGSGIGGAPRAPAAGLLLLLRGGALRGGSLPPPRSDPLALDEEEDDDDLKMLDVDFEEETDESGSGFAPRVADPRCVGPVPPAWPGPYVMDWGQADPNLPNVYNAGYAVRCIAMLDRVEEGDEAGAEALIRGGADVNFRDGGRDGLAALHLAAVDGHDGIARRLLEAGASVDALDKGGNTPLMLAAGGGHLSTFMLLAEAGANVSHSNNMGNTALHKAAAQEEHKLIHALIGSGADPNARNCDGDAPLHHAVTVGSMRVVRLLCQLGADMNQKNNDGSSAVREAKMAGQDEILEWLKIRTNDTTWDDPFPGPVYEDWNERIGNVTEKRLKRIKFLRQNNWASPAYWVRARKHGFEAQKWDGSDSSGELWQPPDISHLFPETGGVAGFGSKTSAAFPTGSDDLDGSFGIDQERSSASAGASSSA